MHPLQRGLLRAGIQLGGNPHPGLGLHVALGLLGRQVFRCEPAVQAALGGEACGLDGAFAAPAIARHAQDGGRHARFQSARLGLGEEGDYGALEGATCLFLQAQDGGADGLAGVADGARLLSFLVGGLRRRVADREWIIRSRESRR